MEFQNLPVHNGRHYLPFSAGKYMVGTTDLMTSDLLLRCYYPTKPMRNLCAKISKPVCNFASLTRNRGKVANIAGITNAWKAV